MPNCFTLTKKGATTPSLLSDIDEELCVLLGKPVDPVKYVIGWVDSIGLALACGKDWAWMRQNWTGEDYTEELKAIDYLEANYTPDAWAEIGGPEMTYRKIGGLHWLAIGRLRVSWCWVKH